MLDWIVTQDQSLPTWNYLVNIIKTDYPIYRLCEQKTESIDRSVSDCPIFAPMENKERLDKTGHYIHGKVCKYYGLLGCEKWYKHQQITEAKWTTILWAFSIQTDWKIKSNRLNIEVKNYKKKTCLLIDMSALTDDKISVQEYHKISKYKTWK